MVSRMAATYAATGGDPVLAITVLGAGTGGGDKASSEAIQQARAGGDYYAIMVIPATFTASQAAAAAGQGEAAPVEVTVNQGKGPAVAAQVQTALEATLTAAGVATVFDYVDPVPAGVPAAAQQLTALFTFMLSMIGSVLTFFVSRAPRCASRAGRRRAALTQLAFAAGLSLLVAAFVPFLLRGIGGAAVPYWTALGFLWPAAFALMALFTACLTLWTPLGAVVILTCLACGMATANLPYEMLPTVWQDWFYPWAPQARVADAARQIYFARAGAWNSDSLYFLLVGLSGLAVHLGCWLAPRKLARASSRKS
jgi:hypothetical protein